MERPPRHPRHEKMVNCKVGIWAVDPDDLLYNCGIIPTHGISVIQNLTF